MPGNNAACRGERERALARRQHADEKKDQIPQQLREYGCSYRSENTLGHTGRRLRNESQRVVRCCFCH